MSKLESPNGVGLEEAKADAALLVTWRQRWNTDLVELEGLDMVLHFFHF